MQFKHPELLWALLLLLIPIFIHLFQLRRFKKTPFTNVKFLQKVVAESRRSNTLKKWLLLLTRMALLACLICAFAQPFFAEKTALKTKEMVVYLDNSFSMQAKTNTTTLFGETVQNFIKAVPEDQIFSLFTNTSTYKNVSIKSLRNDLLMHEPSGKQLNLEQIALKANTLFSTNESSVKNVVLISDFQQRMQVAAADSTQNFTNHLIQKRITDLQNVAIDSVYIRTSNTENIELTALLSSNFSLESIPVSLFNDEKLIAKTAANFTKNNKAKVNFTLPKKEVIKGKIELTDNGLAYDNQLFFNIDAQEKIKVLIIGDAQTEHFKRIYTPDEFELSIVAIKNLNYSSINEQHLIVINELKSIPNALTNSLKAFTKDDGNLVIIPAVDSDLTAYNGLLSNYFSSRFTQRITTERTITDIRFSHPLYNDVFEKKVANFQYPKVSQSYRIKSNAPPILAYQDKSPFLLGNNQVYIFTASLATENSNFKNAPLIVPTLYNIGMHSLKLPKLNHRLQHQERVDIAVKLPQDHILKVFKGDFEFIPQQKSYSNKVTLSFTENPTESGIYEVRDGSTPLKNLSFNYSRAESQLNYLDLNDLKAATKNESIEALFNELQQKNSVNQLWKWFAILAVLFMFIEVLIQKYLR